MGFGGVLMGVKYRRRGPTTQPERRSHIRRVNYPLPGCYESAFRTEIPICVLDVLVFVTKKSVLHLHPPGINPFPPTHSGNHIFVSEPLPKPLFSSWSLVSFNLMRRIVRARYSVRSFTFVNIEFRFVVIIFLSYILVRWYARSFSLYVPLSIMCIQFILPHRWCLTGLMKLLSYVTFCLHFCVLLYVVISYPGCMI